MIVVTNFYKSGQYSKKISIGVYSATFNTNIEHKFPCYDFIKTIDIPIFSVRMDTFRRKFVLGNILLNSIVIFHAMIA